MAFSVGYLYQSSLHWTTRHRQTGSATLFIAQASTVADTLHSADRAEGFGHCDAGLTPIPKPDRPPPKRFSKLMAERLGVTDVKWREFVRVVWDGDHA
ncbi:MULTISPECIES: DUF6555 family protein [unclassified Pseudomonas]|uniref:DUF6555 family protein n=1 Tax=unclassified Pseudomonas TaxID=196821 RepID=UPI002E80A7EE|nr:MULTISPECIES: DUF6555 family protein [unclassified Pseudomonas]